MVLKGIFLKEDLSKLLKNKFIVIIGDSNQRAIYKDLVLLLQKNSYISSNQLKKKGEFCFENDELIEGGKKGLMNNGVQYREVRQYQTDCHLVRFYFVTRCYGTYMESILADLSGDMKPDVVILNSCLWDISRYGASGVEEYKENLNKLFKRFNECLPHNTLVIWNTTLPVAKNARGGVLVPEIAFMRSTLRLDILEANFFAKQIVAGHGYDVLDLHFHMRNHLNRRAFDGVHWDNTAHRHITNLILTHIAEAWREKLPERKFVTPGCDTNGNIPCSLSMSSSERSNSASLQKNEMFSSGHGEDKSRPTTDTSNANKRQRSTSRRRQSFDTAKADRFQANVLRVMNSFKVHSNQSQRDNKVCSHKHQYIPSSESMNCSPQKNVMGEISSHKGKTKENSPSEKSVTSSQENVKNQVSFHEKTEVCNTSNSASTKKRRRHRSGKRNSLNDMPLPKESINNTPLPKDRFQADVLKVQIEIMNSARQTVPQRKPNIANVNSMNKMSNQCLNNNFCSSKENLMNMSNNAIPVLVNMNSNPSCVAANANPSFVNMNRNPVYSNQENFSNMNVWSSDCSNSAFYCNYQNNDATITTATQSCWNYDQPFCNQGNSYNNFLNENFLNGNSSAGFQWQPYARDYYQALDRYWISKRQQRRNPNYYRMAQNY